MDKIKQIELIINRLNVKEKVKIIDDVKNQYSIRFLAKYLKLNRSTYYSFPKTKKSLLKKKKNYTIKCIHQNPELCKLLIEFHSTRKGQIYGYLRIFFPPSKND